MRQGRGGSRTKKCCNRRVAAAQITLPGTLEDPAPPSWKGPGPDQSFAANTGQNYSGPSAGYQNQSPFPGPAVGAGSPAGGPYSGPPTGSSTPQYTASPAPSGSSTPGPGPQPFPPTSNSAGPTTFNGPSPYGSPSSGGPQFGRPSSSGPPFVGGNPHFSSSGQPFSSHQFGIPPGSPFGHGPPISGPIPGHGMLSSAPNSIDRIEPPGCFPVHRRNTPYFGQPDIRIYELNKRLQQRTEESDNLWWDAFATEFFEDDATLTLTFSLEDGAKRYSIGRTLIPRYFRSIFDGGVNELYYNLKHPKESFHNTSITLDCDQCTMVTHHHHDHGKPSFTKVCTEGRLILEFTFDDLMRIKSWHFAVRTYKELIPRNVVQDPSYMETISKNITRLGITNSTLNYLRLCVILEPMQELMSRHKAYALSPRDCLKTTLFQKWQRMVAPPESQRPTNKRRKRKGSQSSAATNNTPSAPTKKRSPGPNFSLASQDVMVVGEPSLMGGEFGDEDERLITRLENTQYDATANSLDHDTGHGFSDSPLTGPGPGPPPPGSNAGPNSWVSAPSTAPSSSGPENDKKSPAVSQ
ncbi:hypothetical protein PGB90_004163 [Kerria lacca]